MTHALPRDLPAPASPPARNGLELSRVVAGMWRMVEWDMTVQQRVAFIEAVHRDGRDLLRPRRHLRQLRRRRPVRRSPARPAFAARAHGTGQQVRHQAARQQAPRHTIQHYDTSAAHIVASAEESLRQLHTDRLDLLLIHRPDPLMDFDEIAEAFTRLKQAGKVLHVGVSNFSRHQFESLNRRVELATNQVEFSPLHTAPMFDETFDGLQDLGVAPMIWSPLAGGRLFSANDANAENLRLVIKEIADRLHQPFASVVFAWIMQLPSGRCRSPAAAASKRSARRWPAPASRSRSDWFAILRAARGHEVA
jgi:predicted oxidoreductase